MDLPRRLFQTVLPHGARERLARLIPFSNTARYRRLLKAPLRDLETMLAEPSFGRGMTERCVEIPWSLGRIQGAERVLEVGCAHAEPLYVALLKSLKVPQLHGLDLVPGPYPEFIHTTGDVRRPPYEDRFFDVVLCISILEHVGRDNTGYGTADGRSAEGDFEAMRGLWRILKPGGRLLVTVPFGAAHDFGWFIQYDAERFDRLLAAAPFEPRSVEYFGYQDESWKRRPRESLAALQYGVDAPAAAALACAELRRPLE